MPSHRTIEHMIGAIWNPTNNEWSYVDPSLQDLAEAVERDRLLHDDFATRLPAPAFPTVPASIRASVIAREHAVCRAHYAIKCDWWGLADRDRLGVCGRAPRLSEPWRWWHLVVSFPAGGQLDRAAQPAPMMPPGDCGTRR